MQGDSTNTTMVVFQQLQDVIRIQQQVILRLNAKNKGMVPSDEYESIVSELKKERQESEKLHFAFGEIQILAQKLEREKEAFEKALRSERTKAGKELAKNSKLNTKCARIKSIILKREDILNEKENQINEQHSKLEREKISLRAQLMDLAIRRQQEEYMARVLQTS